MAIADYTIADQTGASFLTDINGQLDAIRTSNADTNTAGDPTNITLAVYNTQGFLWYDETNDVLKVRVNTSWEEVISGPIVSGDISADQDLSGKVSKVGDTNNNYLDLSVTNEVGIYVNNVKVGRIDNSGNLTVIGDVTAGGTV